MSFPNLSALAVRERSITLFFLILSVLAGLYAFSSMGRAEDPAFTVRAMTVQVAWPGATAEQLQAQVVDRLEKRIQEVRYVFRIDTTVRPGFASLLIEFHEYSPADMIGELFYEVRKRMLDEQPRLPAGVIGPLVIDDFNDVYFTLLALTSSPSGTPLPMRELSREAERLRDQLQRVPGVHKALILGERAERVYIEFDPAGLVNLGINPQDIFAAIAAHNQLVPAGRIESNGPRLYLRLDSLLDDPEQLAQVPITTANGVLPLGRLAEIRRGYQDPAQYLIRSRGQDALLLGVVMEKGFNGQILGENLADFRQQLGTSLPLGVELEVLTDQSQAINQAVGLFQFKFLVAVVVVMLVSIIAIGLRAGLIVGLAVPLTLGITFLLMSLMGINLDRITLGALILALGLLVDDAIIAVEMMLVKIDQGWSKVHAAAHAWTVTAAPMLFGTLVTVAGFFPIGFAKSGVGEYAGNIFWVTGIALIVSWLVAVIFVPYLGVRILKGPREGASAHHDSAQYPRLRAAVSWCVRQRKTVVASTVLLLLLSVAAMATLVPKQFFPSSDRTEVIVSVFMPQGTAIAETDKIVRQLETLINQQPAIESLSSYVGGGPPRFFMSAAPEPFDPAFAKIVAVTSDQSSRDQLMQLLEQRAEQGDFDAARIRVSRLLYGPPVNWPVTFRVLGPDPDQLRLIGHQVRAMVAAHPHTHNSHLEWDERTPALQLQLDHNALALQGLTPARVAQQLQLLLEGTAISELYEDRRSVAIVVRTRVAEPLEGQADKAKGQAPSAKGQALKPERLAGLEILNAAGDKIPLMQLGELRVSYEEPVIRRYNRENYVNVLADVRDAQPNTVMAQLQAQLPRDLPLGYSIAVGGSVEQSNKGESSLQKLQPVMVALMLIFIMLQMRSFSGTFMVFATAPLGLIGAVLALLIFSQPFGFVALLGLTGLAGILMRNTLILTQQVADNFAAGMAAFDAVVEAAVQRSRPVILTALAAMLAFVPLTQDSFWGPLAYVLIGGVGVGTAITLLFVPALYALWFRIR